MLTTEVPTSAELRETIAARRAAGAAIVARIMECPIGEIDRFQAQLSALGLQIAALELRLAEREMIKAELRAEFFPPVYTQKVKP